MIAASGVGWVYVFNAVSFGFVIVALLLMRDVPRRVRRRRRIARRRVAGARRSKGCGSCSASPLIRSTMLLDFFATFFASATALLPIFAQDILHVGARGYGWLFAAPAVGVVRHQRGAGAARSNGSSGAVRRSLWAVVGTAWRRWCSACRGRSG